MTERAIIMCLRCHKLLYVFDLPLRPISLFFFTVIKKVIVLLRRTDLHHSGFPTESDGGQGNPPLMPKISEIPPLLSPDHKKLSHPFPSCTTFPPLILDHILEKRYL